MNFLIIGSGFGLYGYLPAITNYSKKIYLNIEYKKFFPKEKNLLKKQIKLFGIRTKKK